MNLYCHNNVNENVFNENYCLYCPVDSSINMIYVLIKNCVHELNDLYGKKKFLKYCFITKLNQKTCYLKPVYFKLHLYMNK